LHFFATLAAGILDEMTHLGLGGHALVIADGDGLADGIGFHLMHARLA
jgi:hypothetical protein